jgi:nucleoside-diphosphate-sugar epimerase
MPKRKNGDSVPSKILSHMTKKTLSILGCGWLGKAVGARFADAGWKVLGSTTSAEKFSTLAAKGITPVLIQLDPAPTGESLDEFFDADIMLIGIPPKRKAGLTDLYLKQVESLAEFIAEKKVSRVIFISSTSVYADLNREVIESDADPTSYLVTAENLLLSRPEFRTTVLRFGGLVGPDRHPGRFLSGKQNVDAPTSPVNIIHQQDCINIIFDVVRQDLFGHVFNACADNHPSKKSFYENASRALNLPLPVFTALSSAPHKIVSSWKLKEVSGYVFTYPDPLTMF